MKRTRKDVTSDESIRQFYRTEVYEPYVKKMMKELENRFGEKQQAAFCLEYLLPINAAKETSKTEYVSKLRPALELYERFLPNPNMINEELDRWRRRFNQLPMAECPRKLSKLLEMFDGALKVRIKFYLKNIKNSTFRLYFQTCLNWYKFGQLFLCQLQALNAALAC